MRRLPLVHGSRIAIARVPAETVVLAAPPAPEPIVDLETAVEDALRYPISGPSLAECAKGARRVTVVIEHPTLPMPGAPRDPRQEALATVIDELRRAGVAESGVTVFVAGGLERRAARRELGQILRPGRARAYRGAVVVHDAEDPALVPLELEGGEPARVDRHMLETDLVVVVSAAETLSDGGPAALVRACDAQTVRRLAGGVSLLERTGSPAWECATWVERAIRARVPVIGVSLLLDHPRLTNAYREWPSEETARRVLASPFRSIHSALPGWLRAPLLQGMDRELPLIGALAGPPSTAHAEALLRGVPLRGVRVELQLETLVIPMIWRSLHQPRRLPNPVAAAAAGLGHALRQWRGRSPLVEAGTVVLHGPFSDAIGSGADAPYLRLFHALRGGAEGRRLEAVERLARTDSRALDRYRGGSAVHPVLPFADWATCEAVLTRAGRIVIAGCRDAAAAKALGFVPTRNLQAALVMARGVAESDSSLGVVLAPPFPPFLGG